MLRDLPPPHRDLDAAMPLSTFVTGAPGIENGNDNEDGNENDNEDANTHIDPLDDVFGSAPASPALTASDARPSTRAGARDEVSDIPRLRSVHVTNGYREGVAGSKEVFMQEGFDEGYALGAELGLKAGWCLGVLEGVGRALAEGGEGVRVGRLVREAEGELGVEGLFGAEWVGEDGVWRYEVDGSGSGRGGEGAEVTFERVAEAHPVVVKWRARVLGLAAEVGLKVL
ncbi:hypothetical protein LTR08_004036 [Meristemomyces frigidus]|nr:hypothetical protein LTR08_004036 [Meristemomyces frigidus]